MSGRSLLVILASGLGLLLTPSLLWGQSQPAVMATQARLTNGGIPGQQPPSGPGQVPPSGPGQNGSGQAAGALLLGGTESDAENPAAPAEKAAPVEQKVYEHQTITIPDATFTEHEGAITAIFLVDNGTYGVSASKDKTARGWWGVVPQAQNNGAGNNLQNMPNMNAASRPNGGMNGGVMNNGAMNGGMNPAGMNGVGMNGAEESAYMPPAAHTGESIAVLENGHKQPVSDVLVDSTLENIYTASYDGTVRHWVSGSWEPKHRFLGAQDRIWSIALDPSESYLVAACNDGLIYVWQAPTGKKQTSKDMGQGPVYDVAVAPNSAYIATAGADGTVRVCSVATMEEAAKLSGHQDAVYTVEFSADGQYLLTASKDKTARIWDSTGTEVCRFVGHTGPLFGASFLNDRYVVTASADKTVRIWALPEDFGAASMNNGGAGMPVLPMGGEVTADSVFNDAEENTAQTEKKAEEPDKPRIVPKGKELVCYETDTPLFALSVCPQLITAGGLNGTVYFWNLPGPLAEYEATLKPAAVAPAAGMSGPMPGTAGVSGPSGPSGPSAGIPGVDNAGSLDDPGAMPSGPRPSGPQPSGPGQMPPSGPGQMPPSGPASSGPVK